MVDDRRAFHRVGRAAGIAVLAAIVAALSLLLSGCSMKEKYHSALVVSDDDISRGTSRGKGLVAQGANPYDAYASCLQEVNLRVSSDAILRSAGIGLPVDEVAYQIAVGGDSSESGIRRGVANAIKTMERELKAFAVVQVSKARDPAGLEFILRSSTGTEYPPIAVETPVFLRDVAAAYDASGSSAALYSYTIRFPSRGGPGVPPIGPTVRSLVLIVRDGEYEAVTTFALRSRTEK